MKKVIGIILISISLVLTVYLSYNLYQSYELSKSNNELLNQIKTYKKEIKRSSKILNSLEEENNNLKESSKEKVEEYNKWVQMIQEIEEKMS